MFFFLGLRACLCVHTLTVKWILLTCYIQLMISLIVSIYIIGHDRMQMDVVSAVVVVCMAILRYRIVVAKRLIRMYWNCCLFVLMPAFPLHSLVTAFVVVFGCTLTRTVENF